MIKESKCSIEKHIWTYGKKTFTKSTIFHVNGHMENFFMTMSI